MCVRVSSNVASPVIFQNINFIRRTYRYLRKSRRKSGQFNACVTSTGQPKAPSRSSNIEGIFGKENSTVKPSRCSTLRRHVFVPLCLFALTRLSSSSLAMLFFHLLSEPALYLLLRPDAPCEREFWRVVNFINGLHPCRGRLRLERSRCTSVAV